MRSNLTESQKAQILSFIKNVLVFEEDKEGNRESGEK